MSLQSMQIMKFMNPKMYVNTVIVFIKLSLILTLAGCIESDKPLFPNDVWTRATPLKGGYYVVRTENVNIVRTTDENNNYKLGIEKSRRVSAYQTTQIITFKKGLLGFYGDAKTSAELFKADNNGKYIAQIKIAKHNVYVEMLIGSNENFLFYENSCINMNSITRAVMLTKYGMTEDKDRSACYFEDFHNVILAVGDTEGTWDNYSKNYYFKLNDKPEKSEKLKDKPLFPIHAKCSGKSPETVFSPNFEGAPKTVEGKHLRLVSKSDKQALAIEAIDGKPQTYAWLSNWYGDDEYLKNGLGCSPATLIKILDFKPQSNGIIQNKLEPDMDAVKERCKVENSKNECGTIADVIAAYEKRGLKILL